MMKMAAALSIIVFALLFIGCKKDSDVSGSESELYGKWAKGPNLADTLEFVRKNNKNIMRHLESYNAGVPVYSETEYSFGGGQFSLKYYSLNDYHSVSSFTWTQQGAEFQVLAIELFSYISSTMTIFTYRKV
jgi:hypothetical protein